MNVSLARLAFGASAVLFGAIALLWHDAQTWQSLRAVWALPFGTFLGIVLMTAQAAGGVALVVPAAARIGAIVLIAVYAAFALVCLGVTIATPSSYDSFFEQLSLVSGAVALFLTVAGNVSRREAMLVAARIGYGISVVSFTATQAVFLRETARIVPKWIPPDQMFWSVFTTIAFALAAIAILTGVRARLALRLTALMTGLFGVLVWIPILIQRPDAHLAWSELALTFLIASAALAVSETTAPERSA